MPDDTKDPKPKKFVSSELAEEPKETTKDEAVKDVPKVASFSQLDSSNPDSKKSESVSETDPEPMTKDAPPASPEPETQTKEPEGATSEQKPSDEMSSEDVKDWLKDVRPDTTKEVEKKGGPNFKILAILILITAILGAVVGGAIYYSKGVATEGQPESTVSEIQTATATPLPEEPEELDLTTYSVSVLNGSGIAGEAANVKELLTNGGFSEDNITAGNADSTSYTSTSVSVKEGLSDKVYSAIEESLAEIYEVVLSEETLGEDSTYDVIIIVGDRLD